LGKKGRKAFGLEALYDDGWACTVQYWQWQIWGGQVAIMGLERTMENLSHVAGFKN
jgi:hypothetical protein